jgi:hypothetical protein
MINRVVFLLVMQVVLVAFPCSRCASSRAAWNRLDARTHVLLAQDAATSAPRPGGAPRPPLSRPARQPTNIVRLFHGRGKTAVQEKLAVRPLREQDAELAVQCAGTILCEPGWADWA